MTKDTRFLSQPAFYIINTSSMAIPPNNSAEPETIIVSPDFSQEVIKPSKVKVFPKMVCFSNKIYTFNRN